MWLLQPISLLWLRHTKLKTIKSRPIKIKIHLKQKERWLLVSEGNKKGCHFLLSLSVSQEQSQQFKYMLYLCVLIRRKVSVGWEKSITSQGHSGHRMGLWHMEEQSWLLNHCWVQNRHVPAPKSTVWKQDVSCSRLILYLQCAALQLGLFHWVPSDDDGVPRAKFKSLVGPQAAPLALT